MADRRYKDYALVRTKSSRVMYLVEAPAWTLDTGDEVMTEDGDRAIVIFSDTYENGSSKLENLKKAASQPGRIQRIVSKVTYKKFEYADEEDPDDAV